MKILTHIFFDQLGQILTNYVQSFFFTGTCHGKFNKLIVDYPTIPQTRYYTGKLGAKPLAYLAKLRKTVTTKCNHGSGRHIILRSVRKESVID